MSEHTMSRPDSFPRVSVGKLDGEVEGLDPNAKVSVSLVIPARNEAANIAWVLEQIPSSVNEVVLVDGQSTDATLITARWCRPDLRIVTQERTGKGDALRAGFLATTGDVIVMIDADGSMSPREIQHFLYFLSNGFDLVKGSRFMGGGTSLDITPLRRVGNWGLMFLVNRLYSTHLTDLCYGFCAFHRRYLDHLGLTSTGFEIEAEITVTAVRAGMRIAEVPSVELPRRSGHSNLHVLRDGLRVLRCVLRHRRRAPAGTGGVPGPAAAPRPAAAARPGADSEGVAP